MNKPGRPLAPKEVLRVMDAAQVIHERQAALREHEELDRDATIRDIQIMYEELGDLVDAEVIEKALDEYLSQRYAFTPPRARSRKTDGAPLHPARPGSEACAASGGGDSRSRVGRLRRRRHDGAAGARE